jgi:hypothetical protein
MDFLVIIRSPVYPVTSCMAFQVRLVRLEREPASSEELCNIVAHKLDVDYRTISGCIPAVAWDSVVSKAGLAVNA